MTMSAAQLLDELMGSNRNQAPNDKRRETRFDDEEVCKHFLCGFCPCDLFTNTRADLGLCSLMHDEELRRRYKVCPRYERLGYEDDFMRLLQTLLSDVDKRIRKGQARLALNSQMGNHGLGGPHVAREEKVVMLTDKVNELVEQAEVLGCEGKVEEAQGVMKLCEQLQEERAHLQTIEQRQTTGTGKEMEVCNICGALLVVGDAQQRIDEHIMGKQHMGYAQIRSYIESYKNRKKDEESMREDRLKKEREDREKEREQEREERQKQREEREKKEKERDKEREKEREDRRKRDKRSRSRDRDRRRRSRSRDRRRSRSRSRDRRRSRSRDRRRRSRDRHSSRDKDRDSHSHTHSHRRRSRSRSHSKKSRDRDRDRSKERSKEKSRDRDRSRDRSRDRARDRSHDKDDQHKEKESKNSEEKAGTEEMKETSPEKPMETETSSETNHEAVAVESRE